jgi:hypothetical protein
MTQANGQDTKIDTSGQDTKIEADVTSVETEIARIREKSVAVVDRVSDGGVPFDQKTHTLMLESVDRITQQWVGELNRVRDNSKIIEQMVISQAAKSKEELTKLHLLGTQAMKEAQRGHEVLEHLAEEIDGMMAENGAAH